MLKLDSLIQEFIDRNASDLYLTVGAPPSLRITGNIVPCGKDNLDEETIREVMVALVGPDIVEEFNSTLEYNTAISWKDKARFRINLFRQRMHTGIVIRRIHTTIPSLDSLNLPPIYGDLILEKRGLILMVGATGSGKSTSLASMLEYRNTHGSGHIVTIEDPIEFVHTHRNCIITQRDVGLDTYSFGIGLKNALRQSPDVIVIGEIRDRETMEHAIVFSETGHLCLATLHANNANQAIERIINFFPEDKHSQVLLNLSFNLKAILSQRLVHNVEGGRCVALEILLNQGLITTLIKDGQIGDIRECIANGRTSGMQTFDQSLLALQRSGVISEETAIAESDNPANLRLALKQDEIIQRTKGGSGQHLFSQNPHF